VAQGRSALGLERWIPTAGPQANAYHSEADVLLYGGEPGGGKSALIEGLAYTRHERSLIMRRKYGDLDRLIEDTLKIHGSREGFNGSPPPKLRIGGNRVIDFGAAQHIGDEQGWMGRGHDFLGIDEATHFAEMQVRFLMGWVRTENAKQRCRTVFATNPALTAEGLWVNKMFAPWLDDTFPVPAKEGELRWAVTGLDDKMIWVDGPDDARAVGHNGGSVRPKSYTFIGASVSDNPFYANTDYRRELDNMPDQIRRILLGRFKTTFKDQPNQAIPSAWVMAAIERWRPQPPDGVPMCAIGVDCSGGGSDPMIIAPRYDGWFAPIVEIPGDQIPMDRSGAWCAGQITSYRRDRATVVVDLGGGYGGPIYEHLKGNDIEVAGYKGAEGSTRRSRDGKLKFTNKRSAAIWNLREALDPGQPGGSPIAFPNRPKLIADLTSPTFEMTPNGIKVEPKEAVCKRLGRSTNEGDAVIMAWFDGPTKATAAMDWLDKAESGLIRSGGRLPRVLPRGREPLSARGR
jgi:hypothetical protein